MFLAAKRIEGCSERTIEYYQATVMHLLSKIETNVRKVTTEEIREYLSEYHKVNNGSMLQLIIYEGIYPAFFPGLRKKIIF